MEQAISLGITIGLGIVSVTLSFFAIFLSLRFARDSQKTLTLLEGKATEIRTLTNHIFSQQDRYMGRFIEHALEGSTEGNTLTAYAEELNPENLPAIAQIPEKKPVMREVKSHDGRRLLFECAVRGLLDNGVNDPELRLFRAVFDNDVEAVESAIDDGADLNITDTELIRKYFDTLTKPPVSQRLALGAIALLLSLLPESKEEEEPSAGAHP